MYIRKALLFILLVQAVAAIATAVAMLFFQKFSLLGFTDMGTIVAMAIVILGTLMLRDVRFGRNPMRLDRDTPVASRPDRSRWAAYKDRVSGLSYGPLLIVGGLAWQLILIGLYQLMR